jgi:hypothetical protein
MKLHIDIDLENMTRDEAKDFVLSIYDDEIFSNVEFKASISKISNGEWKSICNYLHQNMIPHEVMPAMYF